MFCGHRLWAALAAALLVAACGGGGNNNNAPAVNANLAGLALSAGALTPAFSASMTSYTVDVAFAVTSTTVTPITADPAATVQVDGASVASGAASAPIALTVGTTTIDTVVTAADGVTRKTYQVRVSRASASTDADLADLALTVTMLDQPFQSSVDDYTASVGFLGTSTRVVADASDPQASIEVDGMAVASGAPSDPIALLEGGQTLLPVDVTAEDGVSQRAYSVDVSRAAAATFAQRAYLKASASDPNDLFGTAVAMSGNTLVIGAPGEASAATGVDGDDQDNSLANAGAAYVFVRDEATGTWTQQAYLKASNTDSGDRFGSSVAISGDTVAIGAPGEASLASGVDGDESDNSGIDVGAVYVFVRNGIVWSQQAYVKASNPDSDDRFSDVALSNDTLAVGARGEGSAGADQNDDSAPDAGAVYVFVRDAVPTWTQTEYLKASNAEAGDLFGRVALSGNLLAVGATGEDSDATGIDGDQASNAAVDSGAVYAFERGAAGWVQDAYIKASNTGFGDGFGRVAVVGRRLLVGAPGEASAATGIDGDQTNDSLAGAGAAYLFDGSGALWAQLAYVKATNTNAGDAFGTAVALTGDVLAVGAVGEQSAATGVGGNQADNSLNAAGAVYLYESLMAGWTPRLYVKASNTDSGQRFGSGVALALDVLAVTAPGEASDADGIDGDETNTAAPDAGAGYVFD